MPAKRPGPAPGRLDFVPSMTTKTEGAPVPEEKPSKPDPEADYWTLQDVANHYGIKYASARRYRARGELPPEDRVFGRSPVWRPATIINHPRPGQGTRTDLQR